MRPWRHGGSARAVRGSDGEADRGMKKSCCPAAGDIRRAARAAFFRFQDKVMRVEKNVLISDPPVLVILIPEVGQELGSK